ncbi:MAG: M6 family metalloprotease domain-containing protein [Candidatus Eisenbacteria bacterium]|nr:M6 family metalloprotease domain-containing protein [Candidatus Eisenbacteria bacterium]
MKRFLLIPIALLLLASLTPTSPRAGGFLIEPSKNPEFIVYDMDPALIEELTGVPYEEMVRRRLDRETRAPSDTGVVLALLCQWEDDLADTSAHPPSAYDELLWSQGVVDPGSMREYFLEVSYGDFWIEGEVRGWLTEPTYDPGNWFTDFFEALDPYIDFSDFDRDGDGYTDAVWIFHAGPGQEETHDPNHIWSYAVSGLYYMTDDGVYINRYSCNPEMHADGSIVSIRVPAHEATHVLGLPDLYDYDSKLDTNTYFTPGDANDHPTVDWALMGYAGYNIMSYGTRQDPSHHCAWSKQELGWVTPASITTSMHHVPLPEVNTNAVVYKIPRSGTQEYFLIENRNSNSSSKFDHLDSDFSAYFPWFTFGRNQKDPGMLILHVDDAVSSNNAGPSSPHYMVTVMDAGYDPAHPWDGVSEFSEWWYPYEFRIGAPFAGEDAGQDAFTPNTTPNSSWYGASSGIWITNISESDSVMTFDIGFGNAWPAIVDHSPAALDTSLMEGASHPFSIAAIDRDGDATAYGWTVNGSPVGTGDSIYTHLPGPAGTVDTILAVASDGSLADSLVWLVGSDVNTAVATAGNAPAPPGRLLTAAPNPFNPTVTVRAILPSAGHARLTVHDPSGRRVAVLLDERAEAGEVIRAWNGRDDAGRPVPSGVYLLRLDAGNRAETRKIVLLR